MHSCVALKIVLPVLSCRPIVVDCPAIMNYLMYGAQDDEKVDFLH